MLGIGFMWRRRVLAVTQSTSAKGEFMVGDVCRYELFVVEVGGQSKGWPTCIQIAYDLQFFSRST